MQTPAKVFKRFVVTEEPVDAEPVDQRPHDSRRLMSVQVAAKRSIGNPARHHLTLQLAAAQDEGQGAAVNLGVTQSGSQKVEIDAVEGAMLLRSDRQRAQIRLQLSQRPIRLAVLNRLLGAC